MTIPVNCVKNFSTISLKNSFLISNINIFTDEVQFLYDFVPALCDRKISSLVFRDCLKLKNSKQKFQGTNGKKLPNKRCVFLPEIPRIVFETHALYPAGR